jgi:hypothetical protein
VTIDELLAEARKIWGDKKLPLEQIIIRHGVVTGDMNRYARDAAEGKPTDEAELKKNWATSFSRLSAGVTTWATRPKNVLSSPNKPSVDTNNGQGINCKRPGRLRRQPPVMLKDLAHHIGISSTNDFDPDFLVLPPVIYRYCIVINGGLVIWDD